MAHEWRPEAPFTLRPKPSEIIRGVQVNTRGEAIQPALPPEFFADLSIHHRKELEDLTKTAAIGARRFTLAIPSIDKSSYGKKMNQHMFNRFGSYQIWMKALLKSREGEVLQIDGSWVRADPEMCEMMEEIGAWHVQYAQTPVELSRARGPCGWKSKP